MDNLSIYNQVRAVPAEAQKYFNNGSFSGTDINPMWRIKKLTETFGPCGIGWYTEMIERWEEEIGGEIVTNVSINLYVKMEGKWSKPIFGIGGNKALQVFAGRNGQPDRKKVSDEAYKMAYTDAISVAAKALGIGADIYWQNDPTKYNPDTSEKVPDVESLIAIVSAMSDAQQVKALWKENKDQLTPDGKAALLQAVMSNPACIEATKIAGGRTRKKEGRS